METSVFIIKEKSLRRCPVNTDKINNIKHKINIQHKSLVIKSVKQDEETFHNNELSLKMFTVSRSHHMFYFNA